MKSIAELSSIKEDLIARGVNYCVGAYVDIHGCPKGKFVPISHLRTSRMDPNSTPVMRSMDSASLRTTTKSHPCRISTAACNSPGSPKPCGTRRTALSMASLIPSARGWAFKKVLAQAADMGFAFNLGIECEVYFVRLGERGELLVPNPDDDLMKSCYDIKRFFDAFGLVDRLAKTINSLGWDLYSLDHEDGNSQFEFDFKYADGLTMADRYVFFRFMAKKYAADVGLLATFMPKPFADKTGNGAHFNMSLADPKTGANLFKSEGGPDKYGLGLSPLGYSFIAGILKHGRALCAAFAPTVNSYKRLIRRGAMGYYSWAPVFNSFGTNNRTNSVRVPMGGGRCESRNADSACNPYLAGALALAAASRESARGWIPARRRRTIFTN